MKRVNLIGQKYNKLTVIGEGKTQPGNKKNFMWRCRCDCGSIVEVSTGHLRNGHTKSCRHCKIITDEGDHLRCEIKDGRSFIFDKADLNLIKRCTWSINDGGYARGWSKEDGYFLLHRRIIKTEDDAVIDHINGNRLDNRRCNLRTATFSQNSQNTNLRKDNSLGLKGVYRHKTGRYAARITKNSITYSLGYYKTPLEAARAYDRAASFYFGEYAKPNFGKGGIYEQVLELENSPGLGSGHR